MNLYGVVKCGHDEFKKIDPSDYLKYRKNKYEYELLVEDKNKFKKKYNIDTIDKLTLEDLMVLVIKGGK